MPVNAYNYQIKYKEIFPKKNVLNVLFTYSIFKSFTWQIKIFSYDEKTLSY